MLSLSSFIWQRMTGSFFLCSTRSHMWVCVCMSVCVHVCLRERCMRLWVCVFTCLQEHVHVCMFIHACGGLNLYVRCCTQSLFTSHSWWTLSIWLVWFASFPKIPTSVSWELGYGHDATYSWHLCGCWELNSVLTIVLQASPTVFQLQVFLRRSPHGSLSFLSFHLGAGHVSTADFYAQLGKNPLNEKINNAHRWPWWCSCYLREQTILKHLGFILSQRKEENRGELQVIFIYSLTLTPWKAIIQCLCWLYLQFPTPSQMPIKKSLLYFNF